MSDETPENVEKRRRRKRRPVLGDVRRFEREYGAPSLPPGPFAESYRIAGYANGMVGGAYPECDVLRPKYNSGLRWADSNNPQPGDWRWGAGVGGGVTWDGSFFRDLARYSGSGPLFWSAYLKPGSVAGMQGGFWINFGYAWSHLLNDDPGQIAGGASQKIFFDAPSGNWKLVVEATMFVTLVVVEVWSGTKAGGNDPVGTYSRVSGLDPVAALSIEAA